MTDYEKMTDEELRIEIAKAKGYHIYYRPGAPDQPLVTPIDFSREVRMLGWRELDNLGGHEAYWICPEWPTDIAAAWELESEIPEAAQDWYVVFLEKIVDADSDEQGCFRGAHWKLIHATPRQRCLAYLAWRQSQK